MQKIMDSAISCLITLAMTWSLIPVEAVAATVGSSTGEFSTPSKSDDSDTAIQETAVPERDAESLTETDIAGESFPYDIGIGAPSPIDNDFESQVEETGGSSGKPSDGNAADSQATREDPAVSLPPLWLPEEADDKFEALVDTRPELAPHANEGGEMGLRAQSEGSESFRATVLMAVGNLRQDQVDISGLGMDADQFKSAYRSVIDAHPSLFYARSACTYWYYSSTGKVTSFKVNYDVDRVSDIPALRKRFDDAMADVMSWVPAYGTDLQKVKAVHDWLCRKVSYDHAAYNSGSYSWYDHNAYGALVMRSCVCAGYAYAFKAAMTQLGIPCTYVSAHDHAWNRVRVSGSWYHVDATWDASWTGMGNSTCTVWFMKSDSGIQTQDRLHSSYYKTRGEITHSGYNASGEIAGTNTYYDGWDNASFPSYSGTLASNRVSFFRLRDAEFLMDPNEEMDIKVDSVTPANANKAMTVWSSSDSSVAYVTSDGHVASGGKLGTVSLSCRVGSVSGGCTVRVAQPILGATVDAIPTQAWTGKPVTPRPTVRLGSTTLVQGTDYTVSYSNNVSVGRATITIQGKGKYSESRSATFDIAVLPPRISYCAHVQDVGWQAYVADGATAGTSGRSRRIEAMRMRVEGASYSGTIAYRAHVQDSGWESSWRVDGAVSGTEGRGKRLEALQVLLTGELAKHFDIWYRVHAQDVGWMGWARNGAPAGTVGRALRLEAIQVRLVEKGGTAPDDSSRAFLSGSVASSGIPASEQLVTYRAHVQNVGWQGWACDGELAGTSGRGLRLEALALKLGFAAGSGGIQYRAHVQDVGWEPRWGVDGSTCGTSGKGLRVEAIQVRLSGAALEQYDVWYRCHVQDYGWLGWTKNGEVSGTTGLSKRVEAIQVRLVGKGGAAPGPTTRAYVC